MGKHHGKARTPEYNSWQSMRQRCQNPRCDNFKNYGGRGIRISARWDSFLVFLADVGPRPGPRYSIDRIDNDGHYVSGNVRWATPKQQAHNKRPRRGGKWRLVSVTFKPAPGVREGIKAIAAAEGCTLSAVIRHALHQHLELRP